MRNLLMIAGVAAMAAALPSLADAQGRGKAKGQTGVNVRGNVEAPDRWVRRPDGRWVRTPLAQRPAHPHGCPPGLLRQGTGCIPPGQARRLFNVGERLPASFAFARVPPEFRDRITFDPNLRYHYHDRVVYVVDPRTRLVRSIIDLID
jgi:hypothetical protein